MSDVGSAIEEVRSELAGSAEEFMPDVCSIMNATFTIGGSAGDTLTPGSGGSEIPCSYKSLGQRTQIVVGGQAYLASHRLRLPVTEETRAIEPTFAITVAARGDTPEMTFQHPVILEGSFSPFVNVAATLVQTGFEQ